MCFCHNPEPISAVLRKSNKKLKTVKQIRVAQLPNKHRASPWSPVAGPTGPHGMAAPIVLSESPGGVNCEPNVGASLEEGVLGHQQINPVESTRRHQVSNHTKKFEGDSLLATQKNLNLNKDL